jgi:hypothetical protein
MAGWLDAYGPISFARRLMAARGQPQCALPPLMPAATADAPSQSGRATSSQSGRAASSQSGRATSSQSGRAASSQSGRAASSQSGRATSSQSGRAASSQSALTGRTFRTQVRSAWDLHRRSREVDHRPDGFNPQATGAIGHRIYDHTRFAPRRLEA